MSLAEPVIRCEELTVAYGDDVVLRDVSLDVPRGAFLPFVGPNGAGKTTLLRTILGLVKPRRGRVVAPFVRRPPGYVPQQKAIDPLYPVSTRGIVEMGLYPKLGPWRRPSADDRRAVDGALRRFGLEAHERKTFAELSGGMKQKALLARAFASGAEVFVMDEPTSELDEQSEHEVLAQLHALSRDEGRTVLLAHHGLDKIASLAEMICLVDHGRTRIVPTSEASSWREDAHRMGGGINVQ